MQDKKNADQKLAPGAPIDKSTGGDDEMRNSPFSRPNKIRLFGKLRFHRPLSSP